MGNTYSDVEPSEDEKFAVLQGDCSAKAICSKIANGEVKRIVVLVGAGLSVSAGIPDFRSPGTGLYSQLEEYNLPRPEAIFDLDFFHETEGAPFYKLAKNIWPSEFKPTAGHAFIRLLHDKGLLLRCFTQNIDTLERAAGIPGEKLVEAHGSFASAACSKCRAPCDMKECENRILKGIGTLPIRCPRVEKKNQDEQLGPEVSPGESNEKHTKVVCDGLVKPEIVFFGEDLPKRFSQQSKLDLPNADLVIIAGTSLSVEPFASLVHMASPTTPRLLLNMVPVGIRNPTTGSQGLRLRQHDNYRDVMVMGKCDDAVRAICDQLGWRTELETMLDSFGIGEAHNTSTDSTVAESQKCCCSPSMLTSNEATSDSTEVVNSLNVRVSKPIDIQATFPEMELGFDYNWRLPKLEEHQLPKLEAPCMNSISIREIPLLMEIAKVSPNHVALAAEEAQEDEYFKVVLCVDVEKYPRFDEDDFLAIVPQGTLNFPYGDRSIQHTYLHREAHLPNEVKHERFKVFVTRLSVTSTDSEIPNECWLISNETGVLVGRWDLQMKAD